MGYSGGLHALECGPLEELMPYKDLDTRRVMAKVYSDRHYQDNKKSIRARHKKYYFDHLEESKVYAKNYNEAHQKTRKEQAHENYLRKAHTSHTRFLSLKHRAKRMKWILTLTEDQYVAVNALPCFYCGGPLPVIGYGLDQVVASLGYTFVNVRPCCTVCNIAKHSFTEKEFKSWAVRLYKHWACNDEETHERTECNSTSNP